jgi:hypothetical protein
MQRTILICGEPSAGKSNFIGKSWVAVDSGKSALEISGLPDDLDAVRSLSSSLLGGAFCGRTNPNSANTILLDVLRAKDHVPLGQLVLPDFSGEDLARIYGGRQWLKSWADLFETLQGWLIFIRGGTIRTVFDWAKAQELGGDFLKRDHAAETEPPTDVLLVEINQLLVEELESRNNTAPRIGVVLTCWDELPQEDKDMPFETYIRENLPLFWQFLTARRSQGGDIKYFGLSTTGGDLHDSEYKAEFLTDPSSFGFVLVSDEDGRRIECADVAEPIRWALEG